MATVNIPSLINEEYFKKYSPVPLNFNIGEIRPFFNVAERLWVLPLVGQALYDELMQQVCDKDITPENSTLLLVIYPYLSFSICYEALPFIAYHFSEVGVTKGKSDNSESVSINDVNFISNQLRNQVETMKLGVRTFLNSHKETYPLYKGDDDEQCTACPIENYDGWIMQFYGGNRYDYEYFRALAMNHRLDPNPRLQVYSLPKKRIDLI